MPRIPPAPCEEFAMNDVKKNWAVEDIPDIGGKTAVVTGANSGIGFETALALHDAGARVIMACRSRQRGEEAASRMAPGPGGEIPSVEVLDLGDLGSVESFARGFCERHQVLDILVNNAGVMIPPLGRTAQGFESQIGINHLGHFALTGRLLRPLLAADAARIVCVSSLMHKLEALDLEDLGWERRKYNKWKAYGASKLSNLLFMRQLQRRLDEAGRPAKVAAAHPGWTNTNLQKHSGFATFFNPLLAQPSPRGALPTLYAATAEGVEGGDFYGPGGAFELKGPPRRAAFGGRSLDDDLAASLWSLSTELTGVGYEAIAT